MRHAKGNFSSGAPTGDGGGRAGVSEVSSSAPSYFDAGAPPTPLISSREGGSSRGDTAGSVAQSVNSGRNNTKGKAPSGLTRPTEVTDIFDGSADEDGYSMGKCVGSSPALASMEDECPGKVGDSQGDDPDNAGF